MRILSQIYPLLTMHPNIERLLLFSYLRMHQATEPEFIAGVKDPPGYRPDLTVYDQLMKAGGSC